MTEKKENRITVSQARDTGMAMVLICLIIMYFKQTFAIVPIAVVLLIVTMTYPSIYKPAAFVWFGLSRIMGTVITKLLLSLVFVILVIPVGLVRRFLGYDPMQMKKWKQNTDSVFSQRNKTTLPDDIDHPY